ncbi:hypothetical protein Lal_00037780 [Lupinus albus]|nr:hypothetical protein Lal_00037780 [Lupinus albus]
MTRVCSYEVGLMCANNWRLSSSAVWSESNKDNKSLDMQTLSTSGQSYDSDKESNEANSLNKFHSSEEEKEQCSPVSVLDPSFEDDEDVQENNDEEDDFDLKCSYANVQSMSLFKFFCYVII